MTAPRVLVSGVVLSLPMSGVIRHNRELLPRVARLLEEGGGRLAVLDGADPVPFALPESVERFPSGVPAEPALARAAVEGRALRRALAQGSFDLVHTGHLPAPRALARRVRRDCRHMVGTDLRRSRWYANGPSLFVPSGTVPRL